MDPVSNINQVIQTLRKRLSERSQPGTDDAPPVKQRSTGGLSSISKLEVQKRIADGLKSISSDDEQHRAEVFVENILAWQLGEDIVNDPKFSEMTKDVVATISTDPEHWQQLQKYLKQLS